MYKVEYYTLAVCSDNSIGNIKQFNNTWYTENSISVIEEELKKAVNILYGNNKYIPIITNIQQIKGHL